ncbi:MAG: SelL-related redox protein [Planctomycetota bacterium]
MKPPENSPPAWASYVLYAAGLYNLLWGAWVVLRPNDLFLLTETPLPLYISIWQCVGMIVGVYGIGYAVAGRHPFRHWPIVLVGFLGKTFGPIGMVFHFLTVPADAPGRLPVSWAWVNLTNDLVWWFPFAAILYLSFKHWNAPTVDSAEKDDASVSAVNERFLSQHGESIASLSRQANTLVVFLRHSGCTFCREALEDLRQCRASIESSGTQVVLVHMGDESDAGFFDAYGLSNVHRISDPGCELYRAYELGRGRIGQLFGLPVWWRGFRAAILDRHGVGKLGGDGFQMPGTFLVRNNEVIKAYRHENAASRPDYCAVSNVSSSEPSSSSSEKASPAV